MTSAIRLRRNDGGELSFQLPGSLNEEERRRVAKYARALERTIARLERRARADEPDKVRGKRRAKPPRKASHTIRLYIGTMEMLVSWLKLTRGYMPELRDVTQEDAAKFVEWLSIGGLPDARVERLAASDPESYDAAKAVVRATEVKRAPANVVDVWYALPSIKRATVEPTAEDIQRIHNALRRALLTHAIERLPKYNAMRLTDPQPKPEPSKFTYQYVPRKGLAPSSIATHVAALGSFWGDMMDGDNTEGGEAPLKYNIWREIQAEFTARGKKFTEGRVKDRRLTPALVDALHVAALARAGYNVGAELPDEGITIVEGTRDLLILYAMMLHGMRAEEIGGALRKDFSAKDSKYSLYIYGKGSKMAEIPLGKTIVNELSRFDAMLSQEAQAGSQVMAAWAAALREPDAPLFPARPRWGHNCRDKSCNPKEPLDRNGVAAVLRRIAKCAQVKDLKSGEVRGLTESELNRVHPHAFRHFFATSLRNVGMKVDDIRMYMRHSFLKTTESYIDTQTVELADPSELVLRAQMGEKADQAELAEKVKNVVERTYHLPIEAAVPKIEPRIFTRKPKQKPIVERQPVPEQVMTTLPKEGSVPTVPTMDIVGVGPEGQWRPDPIASVPRVYRTEDHEGPIEAKTDYSIGAPAPDWAYHGRDTFSALVPTDDERDRIKAADADTYDRFKSVMQLYRVGDKSRLPFFIGMAGTWKDGDMAPVISSRQASPMTIADSPVIMTLEALYRSWADDPTKGQSAATSLVAWIEYMFDTVSVGIETLVDERRMEWVEWDTRIPGAAKLVSSWKETSIPVARGEYYLREHPAPVIRGWFERHGASSMKSESGAVQEVGELPTWFFDDDPILSMPIEERQQMRDWMLKVQGKSGTGSQVHTKLFKMLLVMIKDYAEANFVETAAPREIRMGGVRGDAEARKMIIKLYPTEIKKFGKGNFGVEVDVKELLRTNLDELVVSGSEEANLSEKELTEAKVKKAGALEEKVKKYLVEHGYKGVFYDSVIQTNDKILEEKQLTFDPSTLTIVHSQEYKQQFWRQRGLDSECVARRAARMLWEGRTKTKKGEFNPAKYDLNLAYIVPCPRSIEETLRKRGVDVKRFQNAVNRAAIWLDAIETRRREFNKKPGSGRLVSQDRREIQAIMDEYNDKLTEYCARMGIVAGSDLARLGELRRNSESDRIGVSPVRAFFISRMSV